MRALAILLLLAVAAKAQQADPVRAALDEGRYEDALALAKEGTYQHAQALSGIAKSLRREQGYDAAIDYLEKHLDHPIVENAYAECCLWGGQEERGLRGLGGGAPFARFLILKGSGRYGEALALVRSEGWKDWQGWADWATEETAVRGRLAERGARARWLAALGALLLVGGWWGVRRALGPASAPGTA